MPELTNFLEHHPPGRALDLGCGTGTHVIHMAQYGWDVIGIDFIPEAIKLGITKAADEGVQVDLRTGNILKLKSSLGRFDLVLDIGCYQSLSPGARVQYQNNLKQLINEGGHFLMYGADRPIEEQRLVLQRMTLKHFPKFSPS